MNDRVLASATVCAAVGAGVLLMTVAAAGQAPRPASPASSTRSVTRTAWGDPDLQGIWDVRTFTPFERPAEFGLREYMTEAEAADRERRGLNEIPSGDDDDGVVDDLAKADVQRVTAADKPDDGRPGFRIAGAEYNAFWNADPGMVRPSLRTSQIVDPPDGRRPSLTRAALTRRQARHDARLSRGQADSWEDRNPMERCLMRPGLPLGEMVGDRQFAVLEILQAPGYVAIHMPRGYVRVIPLDSRPHVGGAIRQWYGDARGRWDGNSLVFETTNFNNKQDGGPIMPIRRGMRWYPGSGETLRMSERLTRLDAKTIEYRYTVDDPAVFVRPWTAVVTYNLDTASAAGKQDRIFEYACHEHNYGLVNALKGARANESGSREEASREDRVREPELKAEWEKLKQWEASQK